MKLIDLHKEWCEKGELEYGEGLCSNIPDEYRNIFDLFEPTNHESFINSREGYGCAYWGYHTDENSFCVYNSFRQSVVLLICAMNNEL